MKILVCIVQRKFIIFINDQYSFVVNIGPLEAFMQHLRCSLWSLYPGNSLFSLLGRVTVHYICFSFLYAVILDSIAIYAVVPVFFAITIQHVGYG